MSEETLESLHDEPSDSETIQSESGTIDAAYVERLKKEAQKWRLKAKENREASKKVEEFETRIKETETTATSALQKALELNQVAEKRMINAELKALAAEFGLKDMVYAKIGDMSAVKLDASGDVIGAREMMQGLKSSHPDLFKLATTTNINFPSGQHDASKEVFDKPILKLSKEEAAAKEAEFLRSCRR